MLLTCIFLGIATVATAVTYLCVPTLHLAWILPVFLGTFVGSVIVFLLGLFLISLFMSKKKPVTQPKAWCARTIYLVMDFVMRMMRIRVTLEGEEHLPNEPFILISNHRSDFDPMTVLAVIKNKRISYISKQSNFKIPLVGAFIYHAGFLSIDRGNGVRAVRTLKVAEDMLKEKRIDVMGIYPEGTRSKTGELLRFKAGAFLLAKNAGVPIAVMTTKGTETVFRSFFLARKRVELKIVEVIDKETVATLSREELTANARRIIEENLK